MTHVSEHGLSPYQRGRRRILVDMEIPVWEQDFLRNFDPAGMVELYLRAGADAVMFSCKALTGYCFWPTAVGETHPGIGNRDIVGETTEALRTSGIAVCAYYSVVYDNWAFEHHPEWRLEPFGGRRLSESPGDRHGHCCPNNEGYRSYVREQIHDLYGRYEFECAFCDMSFWPSVCECQSCRTRYMREEGRSIPAVIDWTSEEWCSFQAARERWIAEFQGEITAAMERARPGISSYHNFAVGPIHWTRATPFAASEHSAFLGADLYGDEIEQLVVTKLMSNLSRTRPVEYMTFAATSFMEHVQLKRPEQLRGQVLAATAEDAAFLAIDGIDPDGGANQGLYELVHDAFDSAKRFDADLGGVPVEDVAIYFSDASKLDLAESGPVAYFDAEWADYAHLRGVRGACRALKRAHVPFGVITKRQLGALDRFPVVVLPSVARMDSSEVAAFRHYVEGGGRLYASRYTSLVETLGVRHSDFMLADVFGVRAGPEAGSQVAYLRPLSPWVKGLVSPQQFVSASPQEGAMGGGLLQIEKADEAEVLAALSLPYGDPEIGDVYNRKWASVHSFPPWNHTDMPVLVENAFGAGRAVYSALDIESPDADANERLFAGIITHLLGDDYTVRCESDSAVSLSAFREPDAVRVALFAGAPAVRTGGRIRLRVPGGARFASVEQIPAARPLPFELDDAGDLTVELDQLDELTMIGAHFVEESGALK